MKYVSKAFKGLHVALSIVALSLSFGSAAMAADNPSKEGAAAKKYIYHGSGNPYLPLWEHLPDGEPRVFEDPDKPGKFRVYIVGSHDVRASSYCGPDTRAWSAAVEDLSVWRDEGPIFTYKIGNQWDVMYAPDLVEVKGKDGKKVYYLYPHSRGGGREAMVAKGDRPDGPFTPINMTRTDQEPCPAARWDSTRRCSLITSRIKTILILRLGFRAYGYWGFQTASAGELDQKTMYSLKPGSRAIDRFLPTRAFPGEDPNLFSFFEAASIRKIGNKYVWIYSGYSGPEYKLGRSNSTLRYAFGDTPLGPWKSGGVLVDSRALCSIRMEPSCKPPIRDTIRTAASS
jgi:arabinoxylan arabinofuranohydrolase